MKFECSCGTIEESIEGLQRTNNTCNRSVCACNSVLSTLEYRPGITYLYTSADLISTFPHDFIIQDVPV